MQKAFVLGAVTLLLLHSPAARCEDALPQPIVMVATVLELAPPQVEALVTMIRSRDAEMHPLAEEMMKRQQALGALLQTPEADAAAVGRLILEIRTLQQKVESLARQSAAQFEQALTPDQRARLDHIRASAPVCDVIPAFRGVGLL